MRSLRVNIAEDLDTGSDDWKGTYLESRISIGHRKASQKLP